MAGAKKETIGKAKLDELMAKMPQGLGWVWIVAAVGILAILITSSVVNIEPGRLAVKVNNITGAQEAITRPGWTLRIRFLHSVHELDGKPQTFTMAGVGIQGQAQRTGTHRSSERWFELPFHRHDDHLPTQRERRRQGCRDYRLGQRLHALDEALCSVDLAR